MSQHAVSPLYALLILMLLVVGCAQEPSRPTHEVERPVGAEPETKPGVEAPTEDSSNSDDSQLTDPELSPWELLAQALDDPDNPLSQRVIYFDHDDTLVKADYMEIISAHGRFLAEHPELVLRLEGHTDEEGSREYNIALGDRRAYGVRQLLLLNEPPRRQIYTVSYGEERPAVRGHDEAARAKNRRVELLYPREEALLTSAADE